MPAAFDEIGWRCECVRVACCVLRVACCVCVCVCVRAVWPLRVPDRRQNYDYVFSYALHPNGVVEARLHTGGYLQGVLYTSALDARCESPHACPRPLRSCRRSWSRCTRAVPRW
jgi:hypothetical protein